MRLQHVRQVPRAVQHAHNLDALDNDSIQYQIAADDHVAEVRREIGTRRAKLGKSSQAPAHAVNSVE